MTGQAWLHGWCENADASLQSIADELQVALSLDDNDAHVHRILAALKLNFNELDKAVYHQDRALSLNPHHFGAQAGMAQCLLNLRKHRAALKAFRQALRIHPHLDGIQDTIRALETALGEEGRRDDKKS